MTEPNMNCPTVYMFKQDEEEIKRLAAEHNDGETSGDLFGLWTEDKEPVIHLVTGQSRRQKQPTEKPRKSPESKMSLKELLCKNYCLPRIGKWQFHIDTKRNRSEIAGVICKDKPLWKEKNQYVLIIMANYDNSELSLAPYIVSKTSTSTKGYIETLKGENPFRKVEEIIQKIRDVSVKDSTDGRGRQGDIDMNSSPVDERGTDGNANLDAAEALPSRTNIDSSGGVEKARAPRPLPALRTFENTDLKVYMFKEDQEMVEKLVLRYPDVETGGDLFGLWTTEGDAVLHIVLGPGVDCSRTDVSFNQDIPYLQSNGELLTENYMLGHIGEWHSHHQLHLFKPSRGDSTTVIRHFPQGAIYGFLLIIANIVAPDVVTLSPYLYTQTSTSTYSKAGEIVPLKVQNVFKKLPNIQQTIQTGKETKKDAQLQRERMAYQRHYTKSMGIGSTQQQGWPQKSTRPNARNRIHVEPMEVNHDYSAPTNAPQKLKRH